ncbi:MAG: beta-galactosidase [bacterium]
MNKILKYSLLTILILFLIFIGYFSLGTPPKQDNIKWGVNFSQKHTQNFGLDWQEVYSALLNDLGVKKIKVAVHWDLIEPEKGNYDFTDLDWQVAQAGEREAELLLAIGMKTPRWPECHLPQWAVGLSKENQQRAILEMLEKIVSRYQNQSSVAAWQVENEPFFTFGVCPWADEDFLKKEIDLVRLTDNPKRPVYISDSGEGSTWFKAARLGDIVDITMYRKAWFEQLDRYVDYPFRPIFYWRKAQIIKKLFDKEVICGELQAEPWGPKLLYDSPLSEQEKTMDLIKFKENIVFAEQTGLKEFYLWGSEWWYWLKVKQNQPEIWQEATKLFL